MPSVLSDTNGAADEKARAERADRHSMLAMRDAETLKRRNRVIKF